MKNLILFCFIVLTAKMLAQCPATVTPVSDTVACSTSSYNATFTAISSSSVLSVRHDWYSPYSPSSPMYTSVNPFASLTSAFAPGIYTVVTTYTSIACSTTNTFAVIGNSVYPTFNTSSATNYSMGCSSPSANLCITNAASNTGSAGVQYLFIAPTSSMAVPAPTFAFGSQSCSTLPSPGYYTLVVRGMANGCQASVPVRILQDTAKPNLSVSVPTQTLSCSSPTILASGSTSSPNSMVYWQVPATPSIVTTSSVAFGPPNGPPTSTVNGNYATYTVVSTNSVNGCSSGSVVQVYQNFGGSTSSSFTHTVGLNGLVNFNNTTTGGSMTCTWNFGDGFSATGNPMAHTYNSAGAYNVVLTVNDSGSTCLKTTTLSLNVTSAPCNANSNFTVVPTGTVQYWNCIPSYPWNITNAVWSWGDGSSSNGLYSSHTYSAAAFYTICLTATVSCGATSTTCSSYFINKGHESMPMIYVNVVAPSPVTVGIRDTENEEILMSVYPNPNNGNFNLKMNSLTGKNVYLSLNDVVGRTVYNADWEITNGEVEKNLSLETIPAGIYFLKVNCGDKSYTKKMIIGR